MTVVPIQPSRADGFRAGDVVQHLDQPEPGDQAVPRTSPFSPASTTSTGSRWASASAPSTPFKFLGVDPATGDAIYKDVNGDGSITTEDKTIVGNPWPDFLGGFTSTISWKRFDLTGFFQFSKGNDVFNAMRVFSGDGGYNYDNKFHDLLDRWRQPGDITNEPRASFDGTSGADLISSRMIEDASYLRLADLTIGYAAAGSRRGEDGDDPGAVLHPRPERLHLDQLQRVQSRSEQQRQHPGGSAASAALATDFYAYPIARTWSFGFQAGW